MILLRNILFYVILIISTILAYYDFNKIKLVQGEIVVIVSSIVWIFVRKKNPYICLIPSLIITLIGIIFKAQPVLIFLYCGLSIALWDLSLMELSLSRNSQEQKTSVYQFMRLITLVLSLGISYLVIILSRLLNFQIPFFLMFILIAAAFFCFDRIIKFCKK